MRKHQRLRISQHISVYPKSNIQYQREVILCIKTMFARMHRHASEPAVFCSTKTLRKTAVASDLASADTEKAGAAERPPPSDRLGSHRGHHKLSNDYAAGRRLATLRQAAITNFKRLQTQFNPEFKPGLCRERLSCGDVWGAELGSQI